MSFVRVSSVVVILAAIAAGTPAAQACTAASVKGVYGVLSSGLNGSSQPATSVDQITADGLGNVTGTSAKSIDGTIVTYTFTGHLHGGGELHRYGYIHQSEQSG